MAEERRIKRILVIGEGDDEVSNTETIELEPEEAAVLAPLVLIILGTRSRPDEQPRRFPARVNPLGERQAS